MPAGPGGRSLGRRYAIPGRPSSLPRAHTHPGLPVGTTLCLNLNIHLTPEEQTAVSPLLLVQKLPSLLWEDRCAASNHCSSEVISSWSLTWHYCYFYSLSETRRGGCSGFHFSVTFCQSNRTLDRTFIACVAFLTLSASPVPLAIPGSSALSFLLTHKKEPIS